MAEPIAQPASGANLLTQLLGQMSNTSGNSSSLAQQLSNILTNGSTTGTTSGTSSATTTTSAELAPLIAAFTQAQGGMNPEQLTALITSIFTEGARAVPELTTQFANSSGSRVSGNSGLNLALGDLNKNLSSQAVQALLGYNQASQQTAANTAAQIAANTRQTQQTGQQTQQTANTTQQQQQQVGTTSNQQTQQQQQRSGIDPKMASLVGAGGTALNWLDKKGVFDGIFNRGSGSVGGIGTGTLPSASSMPTLTNGGGSSLMSAPAASQGFLAGTAPAAPAASNPYGGGSSIGGAGAAIGGSMVLPSVAPNIGGITNFGGYSTPSGGIGTGFDFGFGALPTSFDAFGTLGTESLGSNLNFGSNPFDYGGSESGITGAVGGIGRDNLLGGFGDAFGSIGGAIGDLGGAFTDGLGGLLGGAADWIGSFFADGGQVQTGATTPRIRNANYMGPRMDRERTDALNYEGYAIPAPVGSSVPAGGSPSMGAITTPSVAMAPPMVAQTVGSSRDQALQLFQQGVQRQQEAYAAARAAEAAAGGGGGNAEGSGQNEADNGQAGIGPSGIAAAPQGTPQGISTALGMMGMPAQGLSAMLGFIAAMAAAVNQANAAGVGAGTGIGVSADSQGAVSSPVSQSSVVGTPIGTIDSSVDGGGGDDGGPASAGNAGTGSAGDTGEGDGAGPGGGGGAGSGAGPGWADGGVVRGPGNGTSDSVKILSREPGGKNIFYSDGEYVIPKDVVDTLGTDLFDRLLSSFHTPAARQ